MSFVASSLACRDRHLDAPADLRDSYAPPGPIIARHLGIDLLIVAGVLDVPNDNGAHRHD